MGYDLNMITEPRFQDAPGDWRAGGDGMFALMEIMTIAGVLESDSERPEFAGDWPPLGMSEERAQDIIDHLNGDAPPTPPPTVEELDECTRHKEAVDNWQQSRSVQPGKVPAYKFEANEGWHVVPEECALIAAALEALLADPPDDLVERSEWSGSDDTLIEWIEDWMDYNRVAVTHGGYRVC